MKNGDQSSIIRQPSKFIDKTTIRLRSNKEPSVLGNKIELVQLLKGHSLNRSDYDKLLEFQKLGY